MILSLEAWPTKAKDTPSLHEVRLTPRTPTQYFYVLREYNHLYNTHFLEDVTTFYTRTDTFKYSFFQSTMLECNKLDRKKRSSTLLTSKNCLLKIGQPTPKPVYNYMETFTCRNGASQRFF